MKKGILGLSACVFLLFAGIATAEPVEVSGGLDITGVPGTDGVTFPDTTKQTSAVIGSLYQKRVTGTCSSGYAIRAIDATGGVVTCEPVGGLAAGTYDNAYNFTNSSNTFTGNSVTATASGSATGVQGASTSGAGVFGGSNGGAGVYGSGTSGPGVYGISTLGYGVHGFSAVGYAGVVGMYGSGASVVMGTGVWGSSTSNGGYGVYGQGATGVYGAGSTGGYGVHGFTATGVGVYGESTSDSGVRGDAAGGTAAVSGNNTANGPGVYGISASGYGVHGFSASGYAGVVGMYGAGGTAATGSGVYGSSNISTSTGAGVYGKNTSSSQDAIGVYGYSSNGYGVYGSSPYAGGVGVIGEGLYRGVQGNSTGGNGLHGISYSGTGVYGKSTSGYAGFFDGDVNVNGNLYKPGGSFKIDHPLDPTNKYLYHSFVESPDMKNIYDGVAVLDANGEAWVTLPDWFEALNKDFRYQLTAIGAPGPNLYIAEEIANNRFKIAGGGRPNAKVSWMVTGIRQDAWANAHRIPVEEEKQSVEHGAYIHPELFGQPHAMSIEYKRNPGLARKVDKTTEAEDKH